MALLLKVNTCIKVCFSTSHSIKANIKLNEL